MTSIPHFERNQELRLFTNNSERLRFLNNSRAFAFRSGILAVVPSPTPTRTARPMRRLEAALKARGLDLAALAASCSVTQRRATAWDRGWAPIPQSHLPALVALVGIAEVRELCQCYEITPFALGRGRPIDPNSVHAGVVERSIARRLRVDVAFRERVSKLIESASSVP